MCLLCTQYELSREFRRTLRARCRELADESDFTDNSDSTDESGFTDALDPADESDSADEADSAYESDFADELDLAAGEALNDALIQQDWSGIDVPFHLVPQAAEEQRPSVEHIEYRDGEPYEEPPPPYEPREGEPHEQPPPSYERPARRYLYFFNIHDNPVSDDEALEDYFQRQASRG
ncbi:hypothetical protein ISF_06166 [Cordyceps fumosorosea ARSEF 2679]|uniref:Uncharacterized protein n=1 Tax=Cordyceps fumosorosea (strain ARSEF 2679) TaxID=1081104 RepID=A0A167T1M3_CORFA|nr:hypothetical protein ISF_06166 [Cordyceps fumosorosea ARSEF 2679]OAA60156.1 hypothetical protein ISF_06166 [Cordyceps fumosorosea ARSEF 2679]